MHDLPIKKAYRPADAANWLGVTTNTIRMWCGRYAEFLSEDANPEKGKARSLTQRDMMVFKIVADGVNNKLTHDEIAEQLVEMGESIPNSIEGAEDEAESPETPQDEPGEAIAPTSILDASTLAPLLQAVQESAATAEKIQAIQEEQGRQRDEQRSDINQIRLILFMLLVVMVLVLVAVVLLVVVMR